jgi:hypothetical protein
MKKNIIYLSIIILASSCQSKEDFLFELKSSSQTNIEFENNLIFDQDFNVYTYRNFYNGGGVSIGDINNDGLPDIYFTSNQSKNLLYLNKGDFKFQNITEISGVGGNRAWSTGVTMVDINADGFLDIYVCNSGDVEGDNKQNELFINKGDMTFTEEATEYGLADSGYSTHASFFDYDKDGDLDVYLLNNSYQAIGSFDIRRNERPRRDKDGGDKLLENQNGKFVDVSEEAGIYGSVIGFGLGVTVGDVNSDGWEDIYVSNDFFERDYLYMNNQDGTFSEKLTDALSSTSAASMGADMADINNDGFSDIFVTEMLPSDYERLKSVTTFENWDKYKYNVDNGYFHQFTRNTLQLNNGDDTFSEIGRLAGVEASDWSWGALLFDMDNDGLRDLFIANGIFRDLTDQDYLQYVSSEQVLMSIMSGEEVDYAKLVEIIPSRPVKNHAYINQGNLTFKNEDRTGLLMPSFSNGSAYGDLDNDGDLDLVVSNVNMPSFVYENHADKKESGNYIQFDLKGAGLNTMAIGTNIKVNDGNSNYYIQQQPIRGFQSSMDLRPHLGLPSNSPVDIEITWPNGNISLLENIAVNQIISVSQTKTQKTNPKAINPIHSKELFKRLDNNLEFTHNENLFIDFNRNRLLPHMLSTPGPKIINGDINGDGLDEIFVPGAKDSKSTLFYWNDQSLIQDDKFTLMNDFESETIEPLFFDADSDGDLDLYTANGGIEFSKFIPYLSDEIYFNDGNGNFSQSELELPTNSKFFNSSTVEASDIDKDGDMDLFVGERLISDSYGLPGSGVILLNNGKGSFKDLTHINAPELEDIGMITDAIFVDIDNDNDEDLIVIGEFMGINILLNENGIFRLSRSELSNYKGWWQSIQSGDFNGDGLLDLVVGNHGLNSRFSASKEFPIRLYVNDFDLNDQLDPVLTFKRENGKFYPYDLRHNLIDQIKPLKKVFPDYNSFRSASIEDMFSSDQLDESLKLEVNTLSSSIFINKGNGRFDFYELPQVAQFSPIYSLLLKDFDLDGDIDIIAGGNLYNAKPEIGRYDASFGLFLENDGKGKFEVPDSGYGFKLKGEVRSIILSNSNLVVGRNSDSIAIFKYLNE